MRSTAFRVIGLIGFGLGPAILFTGCGEQETGARNTLNSIQPSSYVVRPPVTTTTLAEEELDEEGRTNRPQEYVIQAGDFPLRIANLFGVTLDDLAAFNNWNAPNYSEFPFPGTTIGIPPGGLVPGAIAPAASADDDEADGAGGDGATAAPVTTLAGAEGECVPGEHVIVAGDIPLRVANQYDITLEQLQAANSGNPALTQFIPGQTLRIPCD